MRGYECLAPGSPVRGRLVDIRNRWHCFDGNVPHMVEPFEGDRISGFAFTRLEVGRQQVPQDKADWLASLGFPLPDLRVSPAQATGEPAEEAADEAIPELLEEDVSEDEP